MKEDNGLSNNNETRIKRSGISPRELVMQYLPFLPWLIAIVIIALGLTYARLRFMPNVYSVTGNIMVRDQNAMGSKTDKFNDILFTEPNRNLEDEMQLIRSRNMAKRVVKSMGLEIQYYNKGKVRSTLVSNKETPITLRIFSLRDSTASFTLEVSILNEREFKIGEFGGPQLFNQPFETSAGQFMIIRTPYSENAFATKVFEINYASADNRAMELVGYSAARQSGTSTTILQLYFETENPKLGIDIVNQWMKEYQQAGLEEKRQVALNALAFINEQMDTVRQDLTGVERNLLGYKEDNKVYNTQVQSENYLSQISDLEKESFQQGVQMEILNNLITYISDTEEPIPPGRFSVGYYPNRPWSNNSVSLIICRYSGKLY